ncbi:MAG: alpha/beta hydrolase [Kofleriaceae bacterium]|nr:alpha/beta hydrolase [Kofleriaceae bacterium]
MAVTTETLALPGGRFQLLRAGGAASPRPLVIVLHGFPDHPPTFVPVIEALAAAGHDVVAPWLRGYAPSEPRGPFHVERLAADVLELADALGRDRFCLLGHDWGAVITYATCALAPERVRAAVTMAVPHPLAFVRSLTRSLQLWRSWYMLFFQLPGAPAIARARDLALIDRLWRRWSPGYTLPAADRAALHACLAASWPAPIEYYRAQVRPLREAAARFAPEAPARQPLVTPLCHLQGADDGCVAPAAGAGQERWFAGPFTSEVVSRAGHFLQLEAPERVVAQALAWFGEHAPA